MKVPRINHRFAMLLFVAVLALAAGLGTAAECTPDGNGGFISCNGGSCIDIVRNGDGSFTICGITIGAPRDSCWSTGSPLGGGGPTPIPPPPPPTATAVPPPPPTPTPTPDPLAPWDTYPFQGWTPQKLAFYTTKDGGLVEAWFHGYVTDEGNLYDDSTYDWGVTGTYSLFVVTHGDSLPFEFLPTAVEYVYGGFYGTPLIAINGMLDGCENPYPTPAVCVGPPPPADPYHSNGDDYLIANSAGYPEVVVQYAHGVFLLIAAPDPTEGSATPSTDEMQWDHRVVYP